MNGWKRIPGRLCCLALLVATGCQSPGWNTQRFAPAYETPLDIEAPVLGPSTTDSTQRGEYSTARPGLLDPQPAAPTWKKTVPAIRGPIELGPSTTAPPAPATAPGVSSTPEPRANPVPTPGPAAKLDSIAGPELPQFVNPPVSEPEFTLALPSSVLENEPIAVRIDVVNPGSRMRGPLRLTLTRPDAIHNLTPGGDTIVVDALKPRERRSFALSLAATATGEHDLEFRLLDGEKELAWKKVHLSCAPPKLQVTLLSPESKPAGQRAEFTLSLRNTSSEPVGQIAAVLDYDRTLIPVEASEGARQKTGQLTWEIPVLHPGEGLFLQVEFDCPHATRAACVTADVSAQGTSGVRRTACLEVERARGTLQVVLFDLNDLARVGQEVTAVVKVSHLGLQPARRLVGELDIPEGLELVEYVVYRGDEAVPLPSQVEAGVLRFEPVDELKADQTLEFRVVLRAARSGNYALKARVSDELRTEPVVAGEPLTVTP